MAVMNGQLKQAFGVTMKAADYNMYPPGTGRERYNFKNTIGTIPIFINTDSGGVPTAKSTTEK